MQTIKTEAFPLQGGLDLVSPALSIKPGQLIDALNYEPDINGGYRRMYGYERVDGRPAPSAQIYSIIDVDNAGVINVGTTLTGSTSGATCLVLAVGSNNIAVCKITGTFVIGERLSDPSITATVIINALSPQIYRNDWQGNQLLYATSRTNLLTYSEDFGNAAWAISGAGMGCTVTTNLLAAPDGTTTMDFICDSTVPGVSSRAVLQTVAVVTNQTYTGSVYVKAGNTPSFWLCALHSGASKGQSNAQFNVVDGVVTAAAIDPTPTIGGLATGSLAVHVGGGVYRCSITYALDGTVTIHGFRIRHNQRLPVLVGDGVSGNYFWGAQLEVGSVATSYVQTIAAPVTVTDYSIIASGAITFSSAPIVGAGLTWTGTYLNSGVASNVTGQNFGSGDGSTTAFNVFNILATSSLPKDSSATTPILHATYKGLVADNYRADIQKVPGSGPVRGVKYYNGVRYAFRDNAGASACVMFKETASGWSPITFGREILFTGAVGQINEGDVVTGATSGATGTVKRALLRTGTWTVSGVGSLVFDSVTGVFQNAEDLQVGAVTKVTSSSVDTAIVLLPGGRFEFINYNFSGSVATYRMYGCDGVNHAFEFDGTRLIPIRTGLGADTPKYITAWKNMMVLAMDSSIEASAIVNPYSWTALTGAAELALGDVCTGMIPQLGDANNGALAIFTARSTFVLYGNSSADFKLVVQSPDAGAQPYTSQNIGFAYYLDTKGVVQINSSRNFGNFISSTLTRAIQPIIDLKRGLAKCSCIVRGTNQYRIFYSDGTGIILYMIPGDPAQGQAETIGAIMYFDYGSGVYMNTIDSYVDSSGVEHVIASGSDGYVYELEKGASFDGANIKSSLFTAFNSSKSPRNRKHYKRAVINATCKNTAQIRIGYDLSYGGTESDPGVNTLKTLVGGGSYWDLFTWDEFNWDAPYVNEYIVDTPGNGRNINMIIYGDTNIDEPYVIHSAILHYTMGRLER